MKRSILIFIICCSYFQYMIGQDIYRRDSVLYMNAYQYVANDSINRNKCIAVSDSIEDVTWFWFLDDLKALPAEKEKLENFCSNKKLTWNAAYYSPCLASLFDWQDKKTPNLILFFTKIEDLMLRADLEIFNNRMYHESGKFKHATYMWGTAYIYLFFFNEDGTIKHALRNELELN